MTSITDTDMLGRKVTIPFPPQKIVSVVPSQTELLYHLGLENEVVGITKFCIHPETWFRHKQRVGGTKQLHLEAIAALNPDLILANKEENTAEDIEELARNFPVWISDIENISQAIEMISSVARITGKNADHLVQQIQAGFQTLKAIPGKEIRVAYGIWYNPWMFAGSHTYIHDVIVSMGWKNVFENFPRYPEASETLLQELAPDVVLLSSEPYPFKETHKNTIQKLLPHSQVILCDGEMFSWYGSRMLAATHYLATLKVSLV